VTRVTGVAPLTVWNGSTTPEISIGASGASADGYLSSADWGKFNAKYEAATQCVGDLDGTLGAPIVQGIQGVAVSTAVPRTCSVSWAGPAVGADRSRRTGVPWFGRLTMSDAP